MKFLMSFLTIMLVFFNVSFAQKQHVFSFIFKQNHRLLNLETISNTNVISPLEFQGYKDSYAAIAYKYHLKNNFYLGVEFGIEENISFVVHSPLYESGNLAMRPDTIKSIYRFYGFPLDDYAFKLNVNGSYDWYLGYRHVLSPSIALGMLYITDKTTVIEPTPLDEQKVFNNINYEDYYYWDKGGAYYGGLSFFITMNLSYKFLIGKQRNFGIGVNVAYQQGFKSLYEREITVYKKMTPV